MIALRLRNAADMVFSATPATEGGHHALGYIPGQVIWGTFAARVYATSSLSDRAFDLVHSGAVRFSPGYPLAEDGTPAFPWPQCLQHPKHESAILSDTGYRRPAWNTLNGAYLRDGERVQTEPPRGRFISARGSIAQAERGERGKSAIQPGERRVAEAQFFQYEHLGQGQDWITWIEADDPADERLAASLLHEAPVSLGRSKRREYGGEIEISDGAPKDTAPAHGRITGTQVVIWCLSDLAVLDDAGMPNLAPEGSDLGVSGFAGRLSTSESLISTRRFAPYNMYLRARDREMTVIEAGSVLVYNLPTPAPSVRFPSSVGLLRERGLGRVLVEPSLLARGVTDPVMLEWRTGKSPPKTVALTVAPTTFERNLRDALERRASQRADAKLVQEAAKEIADRLGQMTRRVARSGQPTPVASQWGRVADASNASVTVDELLLRLFDDAACRQRGTRAICAAQGEADWAGLMREFQTLIANRTPLERRDPRSDAAFLAALSQACRSVARRTAVRQPSA